MMQHHLAGPPRSCRRSWVAFFTLPTLAKVESQGSGLPESRPALPADRSRICAAHRTSTVPIWRFSLPTTVYQATRRGKGKAIHRYSERVEHAFNAILDDRQDESVKRQRWLIDRQSISRGMPTWALNWKETLIAVAESNLFSLAVTTLYATLQAKKR